MHHGYTAEDAARFAKNLKHDPLTGCLNWTGYTMKPGSTGRRLPYGQWTCKGKTRSTHRIAMMLHTGETIPLGMCVLHDCDNARCCNPEHLRIGTQKENVADMNAKGRRRARTPGMVISDQRAREMAATALPLSQLRRRFNHGLETIIAAFNRLGLPIPPKTSGPAIPPEKVQAMAAMGARNLVELIEKTGHAGETIRMAFHREGVALPTGIRPYRQGRHAPDDAYRAAAHLPTLTAAAQQVGVSRGTVKAAFIRLGIPLMDGRATRYQNLTKPTK